MKKIHELSDMSGRTSVITGAAGYLGRMFSETLSELGSDIIMVDNIDNDRIAYVANDIKNRYDNNVIPIHCDLELDHERDELISELKKYGPVDVLVNNAGFVGTTEMEGWVTSFEKQTIDTWKRVLDVNLTSVFHLTQQLNEQLIASENGSVINISSIYGVVGPDLSLYEGTSMNNPAAYAASKGGMIQLSRWMSTVMAPHVRVNSVSPGGIERGQPSIFQEKYISRTPLNRMGTEEDFKGVIAFLSSDLSSYITGQNIMVDGGWTAW